MLFDLVDAFVARLPKPSDLGANLPGFVQEFKRARPTLAQSSPGATDADGMYKVLAMTYLAFIGRMGELILPLVEQLKDPSADLVQRAIIATELAYMVQPHDLIPDNAPGGYGLVDDCILLHAWRRELLRETNEVESEREHKLVQALSLAISPDLIPQFDQTIALIAFGIRAMRWADPVGLDNAIATTIRNPLNPRMAAPPPGAVLSSFPTTNWNGPSVRTLPGGGSIMTEPGGISISFAGGGSASLVGNDLVLSNT